ncbi:hypothetical protein [Herbaspirillum frisingense]|uniref:hypothetical protein n=1 Tax=Herbaspirillum frisingense TaxID=92645 RepID=UPI0009D9BAF4|nr:hypothetical protein [Herbaspirillum frisingense]
MSLKENSKSTLAKAEIAFRAAFDRLKANRPIILAKGAKISQNNIAREAGCDPSALKKSRYPILVREIQAWILENPSSLLVKKRPVSHRDSDRRLKDRIKELEQQRDRMASLLLQADSRVLELSKKVTFLETMLPSNVVAIK